MVIQEDVPLKDYTTFRTGGPARFFTVAHDADELRELLRYAEAERLPVLILGGGSNVLARDEGWSGLVVRIGLRGRNFTPEADGRVLATAAAGESWDDFVADCTARGLWGLENLSGIPGTVGATPIQNVGAYGVEVKDVLQAVDVLERETGEVRRLTNAQCAFGYRDSLFKRQPGRFVITGVTFRLDSRAEPKLHYRDLAEHFKDHGREPSLAEVREAVLAIRARKFPDLRAIGTAGSFFKNPVISAEDCARLRERFPGIPHFPAGSGKEKVSLAWLLDRACNLKGATRGRVGNFERQPLVIVNHGGATSAEVRDFADHVAACVRDAAGIAIEPEVLIL